MNARSLSAVLDSAATFSQRPALGNEVETLGYVPGTALRGAVAEACLRHGIQPGGSFFRAAFGAEQIRFPNLYPGGAAVVPRSAYTCKRRPGFKADALSAPDEIPHGVVDLLLAPEERDRCPAHGCAHPLIAVDAPFYSRALQSVYAPRWSRARTAVSAAGSAQENSLHTQSELVPGRSRHFAGVLWGDPAVLAELENTLGPSFVVYVGRRRMGRLRVELGAERAPEPAALQRREGLLGWWTVMKLESDAILIDRLLRPLQSLAPADLGAALGLGMTGTVAIPRAFCATRRVAGWSGIGAMFRPDDLALVAGSTFLLNFAEADRAEAERWMGRASAEGIGLRRGEGFGRVTFADALHQRGLQGNLEVA